MLTASDSIPLSPSGGADVAASPAPGVPSPLDRATSLEHAGDAPPGSAAALVLLEARGWPRAHKRLLTAEARERAVAVGCIGQMNFGIAGLDRLDVVWNEYVVSHLLHAEYGHVRFSHGRV